MSYSSNSTTNLIIGKVYPKQKYTAADIVQEFQDKVRLEELVKEKNPGIAFDLLPPEAKQIAREKLKAFDDIVKPSSDQKQEHDSFKSEEQEFKFWYDQVLPNTGISDVDPPF